MYSEEFIAKVKEVYPNSSIIIELVEKGSDMLGRYLDDNSNGTLSPTDVLKSTYEELVDWAHKEQAKRELYRLFSTGACYEANILEQKMCPILYLQNKGDANKMYFEAKVCEGVPYVGYFPDCKNWNCKSKCWEKYHQLNKD